MNSIRDLKYLIAIADLGHFGKAAEACFVSQPTLSAQVKKLEDELGVILFERNKKRILITPIGKMIVEKARLILQNCAELKITADNAKDPYAGIFRLGIIPTLGPYLLPKILRPLKKELPHLELIVHEDKTELILQQLKQGDLDAIILALPIVNEGFVIKELLHEPFYVALSKTHPLAHKKTLSQRDLKNETLLLLSEGHCLRDQALEACALPTSSEKTGFQATSLETLRHLVSAGFGITLLPELSLSATQPNTNIIIKPFASPVPTRHIGMVWRESSARAQCCLKIEEVIKKGAGSLAVRIDTVILS